MADTQPKPAAVVYKRPESVLVVVYTRTGKVLMLKRADHADFWQSITGSFEWGDANPLATAKRELAEETGLVVDTLRDWERTHRYTIFPEWRYKYAPGIEENTEHAFTLELPNEVPIVINPLEHSEYCWLDFPTAYARATSWSNREFIYDLGRELGRI